MDTHFDELETRSSDEREAALFSALPAHIAHARDHAPHYSQLLAQVDPASVTSRQALARLPLTRKSDLHTLQQERPPFGGLLTQAGGSLARILMSPGPIYDPEGTQSDYWNSARSLHAAGFREGQIVQNCFSYHFTPAGTMFESGLRALGCAVIPAGVGQTDLQVQAMHDLAAAGYVGTPSFLKLILERAESLNCSLPALKHALVSGEAFLPAQREYFSGRGIAAFQAYGTADLGVVAYESPAREGLILNESLILEIVRPGTGEPVEAGEVGEVVVTSFNAVYPMIRFATGDLSAVLSGSSPCGRTNQRIKGWMGRADQTTKVRGLFIHPHQVAQVLQRTPGVLRARAVVSDPEGQDRLVFRCEVSDPVQASQREALEQAIRDVTRLRGEAELVPPGTLPNDGKVIEDLRKPV